MKTTRLGKTDLTVSRVGIGGIPIQRPPIDEAIKVVQRALDLGINFVETSIVYGDSEERIGKAIAGRRDKVVLSTKTPKPDKTGASQDLEISLQHLQTDYIDLWQFHNVSNPEKYERVFGSDGAMEVAKEALKSGKIRHIGMSSHNMELALKAVASGLIEAIQYPFNFATPEAADRLVQLAKEYDVGFIAMKPFAGGNIRDAPLALKYLLQFDNVVPLAGVEAVEEVNEIVQITSGSWELTPNDMTRIEEIRSELGSRYCRQCQYCMPCPQGVVIWQLLYLRTLFNLWPAEEIFPRWEPFVKSAEKCVKCGECEEKCPFHLPIREMMDENVAFYEDQLKKRRNAKTQA
jgi:predicted aldo/keto reductase-like oxidoreductase